LSGEEIRFSTRGILLFGAASLGGASM
jgi:hypothetical protein